MTKKKFEIILDDSNLAVNGRFVFEQYTKNQAKYGFFFSKFGHIKNPESKRLTLNTYLKNVLVREM